MFSHIQLGARDLPRMIAFYEAVLAELGLVRMDDDQDNGPPGAGWQLPGRGWPQFFVQEPFNGLPATWGNGVQVSFAAPSQAAVRAAWNRALALGARDEGAPGLRPDYSADYYGAYCRDPEGNKLCFVHTPALETLLSGGI
ncbi:VOC family protein [Pseudomonas gingeri NCPPB 3146 = LMG 5327]|uniref:VOC family protein n=2 Tax=Pseudomonas gingeri TaxID=117681 RepID=A0A7Y8CCS0_9PSED|nr:MULTISPECIES: VOC family protein [Pseudomonas]NVZ23940.1 VOC family protein [Pseudomonas gingeri]NWC13978.1 VOC family protein [Pseudomonas gingeri]NWE48952.1 VOC family protein [Pseudomonas gingeri]PNQ89630.1 VOC family protein [Pseudomonas gingeri NCPPB 3146 = LMG 5327]BBP76645.1 lactoylglutathione lyase [Pseudomonas sp. Ost2]